MGKSFDTFAPIGPCILTADEVPEIIEFAAMIMTLNSGDVLACGTNHEGPGAAQDGERLVAPTKRTCCNPLTDQQDSEES